MFTRRYGPYFDVRVLNLQAFRGNFEVGLGSSSLGVMVEVTGKRFAVKQVEVGEQRFPGGVVLVVTSNDTKERDSLSTAATGDIPILTRKGRTQIRTASDASGAVVNRKPTVVTIMHKHDTQPVVRNSGDGVTVKVYLPLCAMLEY